jgi:hypothetical protein
MRSATVDELAQVPGISAALAAAIRATLDRLGADLERSIDTGRGRLVAVPMETADDGQEGSPEVRTDAATPHSDPDVDSNDSGDYAVK